MAIIPTKPLPPAPETLPDVISWIREFNANGPPLDPGTASTDPSIAWDQDQGYLYVPGAGGGGGGLTGNASDYNWTVNNVVTSAVVNGFNIGGGDRDLETNLFKMGVGTPSSVSVNTPPVTFSTDQLTWARNIAATTLETHFCLQQLIRDLIARGVLS